MSKEQVKDVLEAFVHELEMEKKGIYQKNEISYWDERLRIAIRDSNWTYDGDCYEDVLRDYKDYWLHLMRNPKNGMIKYRLPLEYFVDRLNRIHRTDKFEHMINGVLCKYFSEDKKLKKIIIPQKWVKELASWAVDPTDTMAYESDFGTIDIEYGDNLTFVV
jgi:hypothetical protein